jgi:hypothetical protein
MNKITIENDIVFLGDVHLEEDSIGECFKILDELVKSYPKECTLVQLGDLTDKNKLNAIELDALTEFAVGLASHFKQVIFIDGNHSKLDKNNSIINYLVHLRENIEVYQDELELDFAGKKIIVGHFFLDTSNGAFGDFRYKAEELSQKYDYGLFGHQHDLQDHLAKKGHFLHLGSARYTSFGEDLDNPKYYAYLDKESAEQGLAVALDVIYGCTRLVNIYSLEELASALESTQVGELKVRYIISSFEQLKKEIDLLKPYKNAFAQFKIHNQFINDNYKKIEETTTESFNSAELINTWIEKIEDKDVKQILTEAFTDAY